MENDAGDLVGTECSFNRSIITWPRNYSGLSMGNHSVNKSPASTSMSKTPSKYVNHGKGYTKPTPNKRSKTPITIGDRFIPNRSATQFDIGHYKIMNESNKKDEGEIKDIKREEYKRAVGMCLSGCDIENTRIIAYKPKAPPPPEGYQSELRVLYNQGRYTGSSKKSVRHIPSNPDRILDAPEIIDDYYLNIMDWSSTNLLAVGLSNNLYLWNASNGKIDLLMELEDSSKFIASLSWIDDGSYIAVGISSGEVEMWDVKAKKRIRCMTGHTARVSSLAWNQYILSSGSRSGHINHHDVRVASHFIGSLAGHTQDVCGLRWSPNGRYLASGGNDNLIHIWPAVPNECHSEAKPIYTFNQHSSAVKALSWCPWQTNILASGGGTSDRTIKLWNCNTGSILSSTDTQSQVCALLWSKDYKELISGHGYAHNQLIIWKYPSMNKVCELVGHQARVLHLASSPDGQVVASAAADETIRLWKCFEIDPIKAKNDKKLKSKTSTIFKTIR